VNNHQQSQADLEKSRKKGSETHISLGKESIKNNQSRSRQPPPSDSTCGIYKTFEGPLINPNKITSVHIGGYGDNSNSWVAPTAYGSLTSIIHHSQAPPGKYDLTQTYTKARFSIGGDGNNNS
jgi:hypothetical protein